MSTHLCPALGPILLYSNTPSPAEAQAIAIVQSRQPCIDRPLRLIVLQTPLEIPNEREVTTLHNQFSGHGVEVLAMDAGLQTRGDAHDPEVIAVIRSADIVLVTGGEPARMERVIRDTPALLALQEARAGGVLIGGGSAGAMIFGQGMLDGPRDSRIPTRMLGWLSNIVVAPHFGNYPIEPWLAAYPTSTFLCLPDEAIALVTDNGGRIVSAGNRPLSIIDCARGLTPELSSGMTWTR
ncbi:MAG: Type 1 glutamine amidotransferase-like domain-containing protein [Thermomicrobiales bacterium]